MKLDKKYAKCDVCGETIQIDKYGNGDECFTCGWRQSEESFEHPNVAGIRNIPTLNNARLQYINGKSATLANFNDFVEAYEKYGEIEFTYNKTRYGVMFNENKNSVMLFNIKTNEAQYHKTIEDFENNAQIDGVLLKDLWMNVENTDFLQDTN